MPAAAARPCAIQRRGNTVYTTQLILGRDTVTNTCKGQLREPSFVSTRIVRFHQSACPIAACTLSSPLREVTIWTI